MSEAKPHDPNAWIPKFLAYIRDNPDRPQELYSDVLTELVSRGLVVVVPRLTASGRKALKEKST